MRTPLKLAVTLAALGLLCAGGLVTAPVAAGIESRCPDGEPGIYVPPGSYGLVRVMSAGVGQPAQSTHVLTVEGPGGQEHEVYVNTPGIFLGAGDVIYRLEVAEPGLGVCGIAPTRLYLAYVDVDSDGSPLPYAHGSGTPLVVTVNEVKCAAGTLVYLSGTLGPYHAYTDLHLCTFAFAVTPVD